MKWRMSVMEYLIITSLLSQNPNANQLYTSGSIHHSLSTFGWISHAPMNSIHQLHLHILQLLHDPEQKGQEKSTSTPGSTNGKNPGLKRISTSFQKISESIVLTVYLR